MNPEILQNRKKELEAMIIGLDRALEQHKGRLAEVNEMISRIAKEKEDKN